MLGHGANSKDEFLMAARAAREQRMAEKAREEAVVVLQANVRGWLARLRVVREVATEFDESFCGSSEDNIELKKSAVECYKIARNFLSFCKVDEEVQRFERLCRYILASLDSGMSSKRQCMSNLPTSHVFPSQIQLGYLTYRLH